MVQTPKFVFEKNKNFEFALKTSYLKFELKCLNVEKNQVKAQNFVAKLPISR